jgi:hypothetical protein
MRHTVYKLFIATQYEQEEKWLNEMSAKGLALVHAGLCKYIFEDEEPGKYTYKIELLDRLPSAASSRSYLLFLEDAGVETIATIFRWVYLRKKTEDGPFALYSDVDSTIRYFRRLQVFFITLAVLEYVFGIQNVLIGAFNNSEVRVINIVMGLLLLFLGVLLTAAAVTHTRKLRELRRERQIRE